MANNYTSLVTNRSTNKILLVRMKPRRNVTPDLSLDSGTTYTATFEFSNMPSLQVNGVEYTKVTGVPSSGEFAFNESTKLLTVNLGSALTTQIVIADHYLFYTTYMFRIKNEDPLDNNTANREWEPRILSSPSFTYSIENVLAGIVSYSNSDITINNMDRAFNAYVGDNDSFNNAEIVFYHVLDDVENVSFLYKGKIKELNIAKTVSVNFDDEFTVLDNTFYSNGNYEDSIVSIDSYTINPSETNKKIIKAYGKRSSGRYEITNPSSNISQRDYLNPSYAQAININYSTTLSTTTNNVFMCHVQHDVDPTLTMTVNAKTGGNSITISIDAREISRGDILIRTSDSTSYIVESRNSASSIDVSGAAGLSVSDTLERQEINRLIIFRSDGTVQGVNSNNFTIAVDSIGAYKVTISAAQLAILGNIEPGKDSVYFYSTNHSSDLRNHADILKDVLEKAGMTVNASTFTAAKSALNLNLAFTIPFDLNTNFPTYRQTVEKILRATSGYITLNNDNEVEYYVFDNTTGPNSSVTIDVEDREVMLNSLGINIDYIDVYNNVTMRNTGGLIENSSDFEARNTYDSDSSINNKTKYLHNLDKTYPVDSYTDDNSTSLTQLIAVLNERRAIYNYTTKGIHFDRDVGSLDVLKTSGLLSNEASRQVTTVSMDKTKENTKIKSIDLLNI